MKIPLIGAKGDKKEDISFKISDEKISNVAIYESMKNHQSLERLGTAFIKNRALVHGTGKKPWRQKGTGRARASSMKLPQMRGGGAAFGNQRRNFKYAIPKKLKTLAMKSVILTKINDEMVKVIDKPEIKDGKTKELIKKIEKMVPQERVVMIIGDDEPLLRRAARNISWLECLNVKRLLIDKLFYSTAILVVKDVVDDFVKVINR